MSEKPEPTPQDLANATARAEIAVRQQAEYTKVLAWALSAFGPGWLPSHRHYLLELDEEDRCRYTEERPTVAATVYSVKNAAGRQRHFTIEDGKVKECESYAVGFGDRLLEAHPTRTIAVRGQLVHPQRYSLCWAGYELYVPKTAKQLAALRVSRERGKSEREERKWVEENPLLAWAERVQMEETTPER